MSAQPVSVQALIREEDLIAWAGPELEDWAFRRASFVSGLIRMGWDAETLLMVAHEVVESRGVRDFYVEMRLWAQTMATLPSEWTGLLPVSVLIRAGIRRREVLSMVWRFYRDRLADDPEAGGWTTPEQVAAWHRAAVADFVAPLAMLAGLGALDAQAREAAARVISTTRMANTLSVPEDYPQD